MGLNKTGLCYLCKDPLYEDNFSRDHFIPKSSGYRSYKLYPCCLNCNREKRNMMPEAYIWYLTRKKVYGKKSARRNITKLVNARKTLEEIWSTIINK